MRVCFLLYKVSQEFFKRFFRVHWQWKTVYLSFENKNELYSYEGFSLK